MNRRTFLSIMAQGSLTPLFAPGLVSQLFIRQCAGLPNIPLPDSSEPRLTVVGIGRFGVDNARLVARDGPQITCHEILVGQTTPTKPADFDGLFRSIRHCDILFIVCGHDDCYCAPLVKACTETAQSVSVPVVTIVPHQQISSAYSTSAGATFSVSDQIAARHLVTTISHLVASPSFVGIDIGDITAIVQSGSRGMLGSGSAAGKDRGQIACLLALDSLRHQGFPVPQCRGAFACLYGAPSMVMDDYDQALTALRNYFPKDLNIVFGCTIDEQLGSDVRVTIAAVT